MHLSKRKGNDKYILLKITKQLFIMIWSLKG